jgi:ABC-type dipeptide/oligopeptide/nickel transport system ATPase component
VNMAFEPGRLTVLNGPSGSGKTTIIDLLIGLHTASSGRILIGARPIEDIDITAWRKKIGYVPQELSLLHESVRTNISFGDSSISDAEILAALEKADAGDCQADNASAFHWRARWWAILPSSFLMKSPAPLIPRRKLKSSRTSRPLAGNIQSSPSPIVRRGRGSLIFTIQLLAGRSKSQLQKSLLLPEGHGAASFQTGVCWPHARPEFDVFWR